MKAGRVFKHFAVAGLIFAASILSACGSGNSSNGNSSNSTVTAGSNANAGAVETGNKDTSPVTIKISDLFAEAKSTSVSSMMQKYSGRPMTVNEGVLYEFNVDNVKVGDGQNPLFGKESTEPQYFVTCKGTFTDDDPNAADRVELRRMQGKAPATTVKGIFKEYGNYNNKNWVILDQCTMTKS
ncbi:MAG TPA: hypothetical protein VM095_05430 [Pyrinomonadaceae bacterium]|nr:hypothetical protein [Pyrinomonadaceae bacterium]